MNPLCQRLSVLAIAVFSAAVRAQVPSPEVQISASHAFTPEQRTEIEARDQLARTIAANVEGDAQGRFDQQWRVRLMSTLYAVPSAKLRDIAAQARTVAQAQKMGGDAYQSKASFSTNNPKALGDFNQDLVFTPVTACRFIDTRNLSEVIPKGAGAFTAFDTFRAGSSYGGDGSCILPGFGELAIAANITVTVDSGAAGFLGIRPLGSTTRSSLVNWPTGGTTGIANAAIITTAQDAGSHYEFEAYAGGNTPYLILDYFGYFAPPAPTALDCFNNTTTTYTVPSQSTLNASAFCSAPYVIVSTNCVASTTTLSATGPGYCQFRNSTAASVTVSAAAYCCRVP